MPFSPLPPHTPLQLSLQTLQTLAAKVSVDVPVVGLPLLQASGGTAYTSLANLSTINLFT